MEQIGGLLGIGEKETDFKFGSTAVALELLKQQGNLGQPVFEYNQAGQSDTTYWCTIFSAFTELSYLKKKFFSITEMRAVGNAMIKDGTLDPNSGALLQEAMNHVMKWYNANHSDKVKYYQIDYLDKELVDILINKVVRLTQMGFRISTELLVELQTKGYASKKDYPKYGGHAITKYGLNCIDNYKGHNKNNRYSFEFFEDLIRNKVIYRTGYVFLNA